MIPGMMYLFWVCPCMMLYGRRFLQCAVILTIILMFDANDGQIWRIVLFNSIDRNRMQ